MVKVFRKVEAKESINLKFDRLLELHLKEFETFAELISIEKGKVKGKSGKASSYRRYLCKLSVIYFEGFGVEITDLYSFDTLKAFELLELHPQFKQYNSSEGSFPLSTINCYRAFLAYIHTVEKEEQLVDSLDGYTKPKIAINYANNLSSPKAPKIKEVTYYERDINEKELSRVNSDSLCEIDNTHLSFISKKTGKNYVESHHLIPLSIQGYFDYSIDIAVNLISLCPNCHRKIHYGTDRDKSEMIKKLFNERKSNLEEFGIKISLNRLLSYYNV